MSQVSRFLIDLPIRNEWSHVDLLRVTVQNCLTLLFSETEGCEAVAMVAGELLENAVKYGDWTGVSQVLRVSVEGEGKLLRVMVENPVRREGEDVKELLRVIAMLGASSSREEREEAYRARLIELAASDELSSSRLGLLRIAYEGNCTLRAKILENGNLCTTAEMQI